MNERFNAEPRELSVLGLTRDVVARLTASMRWRSAEENEAKYNPRGLDGDEWYDCEEYDRALESYRMANFGYVVGCDYKRHYLLGEFDE